MSAYSQEGGGARVANAWGHFAPELLSAGILAAIALGLRPPASALALTLPIALMAFIVATWLLMRRHDRRLCEQCVASMPLNPAARAVRLKRRFWLSHFATEPRFLIPYFTVLIGSNFLPGTWGRIVWAVIQCSMIYLILSYVSHRRLQPWCPWCSDGGGGTDHDDDVAPPPLPDNDRELV